MWLSSGHVGKDRLHDTDTWGFRSHGMSRCGSYTMAATAPRNMTPGRAAGAAPVLQRPTVASDVPLDDTRHGIVTALGYYSDPSLPVVGGIVAGCVGGLAAAVVALLLMRGSVSPGALDAIAPLAVLIGVLLVGAAGGLGGLLVLLAAERPRRAVPEPVANEPVLQA